MSKVINCFLLEPSNQVQHFLRRFQMGSQKQDHYHNARVVLGQLMSTRKDGHGHPIEMDHVDPRWPTQCSCGYIFQEDDYWQSQAIALYKRTDNGQYTTLSDAPVGAMWDADWMHNIKNYRNSPDGKVLVLKTPAGDWIIDGPSNNGNGWTRKGTPPQVTATPSIMLGKGPGSYHGWLKNGQLIEC